MLDVHRQGKLIHLTMFTDESFIELFDSKIQIGPMTRYITGKIARSVAELEQAINTLKPDGSLPLELLDVEVIEVFPHWFICEAERLGQLLLEKFGVEAVYLFGSLAWSDIHAPETDIDLAVSGLSPERYLEAVGYLERATNFPVDLVELEKISDHLRQRILSTGKLLGERESVIAFG